jgi:hypothetical protein
MIFVPDTLTPLFRLFLLVSGALLLMDGVSKSGIYGTVKILGGASLLALGLTSIAGTLKGVVEMEESAEGTWG